MPTPDEVAVLTRHTLVADRGTVFDTLLRLLQSEGCFIESADKASGVVSARQMFPGNTPLLPSVGEIRSLSFLVLPAGAGSEVRLTVFTAYQQYSGGSPGGYYTEQLGMATDPGVYETWFSKIDGALKH